MNTGDMADENRRMFERIAARYDILNRIISFGMDEGWRREIVREMKMPSDGRALDVATGTADVALAVARIHAEAEVVGIDITPGMIGIGHRKIRKAGYSRRIRLQVGNATDIDFPDDGFDAACCAFGIRNVEDRPKALREMARVVKPGGRVVILEPGKPRGKVFGPLFSIYFRHVLPGISALLSDRNAYRYLVESVRNFPEPEKFCRIMDAAGLKNSRCRFLSGGGAVLYIADKFR